MNIYFRRMKQGKLRMLLRNVINFLFEIQRPYVGFIRFVLSSINRGTLGILLFRKRTDERNYEMKLTLVIRKPWIFKLLWEI